MTAIWASHSPESHRTVLLAVSHCFGGRKRSNLFAQPTDLQIVTFNLKWNSNSTSRYCKKGTTEPEKSPKICFNIVVLNSEVTRRCAIEYMSLLGTSRIQPDREEMPHALVRHLAEMSNYFPSTVISVECLRFVWNSDIENGFPNFYRRRSKEPSLNRKIPGNFVG
jgi:hypothetical protein